MPFLTVLLPLLLLYSCGKSNSNAGIPRMGETGIFSINGSNINGLYSAQFKTLNSQVNGNIQGTATLQRQEDDFLAFVRLFGGASHVWHPQNVHEGTRCPTTKDDLNGDGYIDIEEGNRVWGKVLIPLDSNLSSQNAGKNIFPTADQTGTYFYERTTKFTSMFEDLTAVDPNPDDHITKVDPNKGLDFVGKVVVVHGTDSSVVLPDTVASTSGHLPYQTLPIACGVLKRVTSVPDINREETPTEPEVPTQPIPEQPVPEVPRPEQPVPEIPVPEIPRPEIPRPEIPRPEDPTDPDDGGDDDTDDDYDDDETDEDELPPNDEGNPEDDSWADRVAEWWRSRWERDRGPRRQTWGNGRRRPEFP